jgi:hypothetical protein
VLGVAANGREDILAIPLEPVLLKPIGIES